MRGGVTFVTLCPFTSCVRDSPTLQPLPLWWPLSLFKSLIRRKPISFLFFCCTLTIQLSNGPNISSLLDIAFLFGYSRFCKCPNSIPIIQKLHIRSWSGSRLWIKSYIIWDPKYAPSLLLCMIFTISLD